MPETERSSFEVMWAALEPDERYEYAIRSRSAEEFLGQDYLLAIAMQWHKEIYRARAMEAYRKVGGWAKNLETSITSMLPALEPFLKYHNKNGTDPGRKRTKRLRAETLHAMALAPLEFIIPEILPAGCTMLVGKSKDGKSLMAYNLALAIASGGIALGKYPVAEGRVWYLALEDGERRAQKRLKEQMAQLDISEDALKNLELTLWESQRIGAGLEEDIKEWVGEAPKARLVIIDILEKVRAPRKQKGNTSYEEDYAGTASLTRLAQDLNIAILVVHHSNKTNPDDVRDSISGTTGLMGGTDASWILRRNALETMATMAIMGREVETQELALRFEGGFWTILGDAHDINISVERLAIMDLLRGNPQGLGPKAVAEELDKNYSTVKALLKKMRKDGDILQLRTGIYGCPGNGEEF